MKIGWVGLGSFGFPIAINLLEKGYEIYGFSTPGHGQDRIDQLVLNKGIKGELTQLANMDALLLCLPTTQDVVTVLNYFEGRLPKYIIDLTTGNPVETQELYQKLELKDAYYVDAPVSGSVEAARNGQLTVFVGANKNSLPKVISSILESIGNNFYFNQIGNGQRAKLINQLIHLSNVGVIGEAIKLADSNKLDIEELLKSLKTSSASSKMLERFGDSIICNDFAPFFKLKLADKDINLVASSLNVDSLNSQYLNITKKLLNDKMNQGFEDYNFTIMCK